MKRKTHSIKRWNSATGEVYSLLVKINPDGTVTCPYCQKKHRHVGGSGHRLPHCRDSEAQQVHVLWEVFTRDDGYYIEQ